MVWRFRSDADLVTDVPATRRIMPFIMRTRNESVVYFDQKLDLARTHRFLEEQRQATGQHVTLLHLLLWAFARTVEQRPRLNRFTAGYRIWQRRGVWACFSAKKGFHDQAPIVVIKRKLDPAWSLLELVEAISAKVKEGKSDKRSSTDTELGLLFSLPTFVTAWIGRLILRLDHWGLLPRFFLDGDPMFGSVFVANLGSIGMDPGYHHLYEYGNIPIFMVVGQAQEEAVVEDGEVVVKKLLPIRYSFDERVEDGLYCARALSLLKEMVEDPEGHGALGPGPATHAPTTPGPTTPGPTTPGPTTPEPAPA